MTLPMPADFCLRLGGGMSLLLLLTSWRAVPPAFFRTHCQIILALFVVGALDSFRAPEARLYFYGFIILSICAYLATASWGLGLPRIGFPLTLGIALFSAAMSVGISRKPAAIAWGFDASDRLLSGFLMGSTLSAMLLGHHYLTAPSMTIDPLRRYIRFMTVGLAARLVLAIAQLGAWMPSETPKLGAFMLFIRWGMGFGGPVLGTYLAWETVKIRSTQSATGILYIAMTLLLFGELTSMILARGGGFAI